MGDKNAKVDISQLECLSVEEIVKNISSELTIVSPNLQDNFYIKAIEESRREKKEYDKDTLQTLKNIEKNTATLTNIIKLIQEGNDKQDDIYLIITELLALAKLKDKESV